MRSKIAVLLAAYNGESWICEQVESLVKQRNVDIKIFISVDLSTDNTFNILSQLNAKYQNIELLPYGKKFGGAAKNFYRLIKDVDFSSFDYVALSDQDDIWLPNKLENGVLTMQKSNCVGYSSDVVAVWADGRSRYIKKSYSQRKYDYMFESGGPGCTYILKVEVFTLFKNKINSNWSASQFIEYHDWFIYCFFRSNNFNWIIDSSSFMHYRQHESNQIGANTSIRSFCTRINMITNGWYFDQIKKMSEILNFSVPTKGFLLKNFLDIRRNRLESLLLFFLLINNL